ncbi:MAG: pilus assembly protein [Sutterella sp.]|nr:pilus assembly protein [Sutterella sp.]
MKMRESLAQLKTRIEGFCRDPKGVSATEAAFVYPAVLIVFFGVIELVNMAITIQVAESAISSALVEFREDGTLGPTAENDIKSGISAHSFGWLERGDVTRVTVEPYESLASFGTDGTGGNQAEGEDEDEEDSSEESRYPLWRVVVTISSDFVTPIPRMLLTERKDFTYRYERVIGYLPKTEGEDR